MGLPRRNSDSVVTCSPRSGVLCSTLPSRSTTPWCIRNPLRRATMSPGSQWVMVRLPRLPGELHSRNRSSLEGGIKSRGCKAAGTGAPHAAPQSGGIGHPRGPPGSRPAAAQVVRVQRCARRAVVRASVPSRASSSPGRTNRSSDLLGIGLHAFRHLDGRDGGPAGGSIRHRSRTIPTPWRPSPPVSCACRTSWRTGARAPGRPRWRAGRRGERGEDPGHREAARSSCRVRPRCRRSG